VREDVKIERNTAGVTGNRLDGLGGGGCSGWFDILGAIMVDELRELVEVIVVQLVADSTGWYRGTPRSVEGFVAVRCWLLWSGI